MSLKYVLKTVKNRWFVYLGYAAVGIFYLVLRFFILTNPGDGIKPNFANAHYKLALIYHKRQMMAEAIRHYNKVIELEPEDIEARNNLGVAFAMQGDIDQAIIEWQNVLIIVPANINALDNVQKVKKMTE